MLLKAWAPVPIPTVYNPVTSLLVPHGQGWLRMKTTAETRAAQSLPVPVAQDSLYKPVERVTRRFNPLAVPKALQVALATSCRRGGSFTAANAVDTSPRLQKT